MRGKMSPLIGRQGHQAGGEQSGDFGMPQVVEMQAVRCPIRLGLAAQLLVQVPDGKALPVGSISCIPMYCSKTAKSTPVFTGDTGNDVISSDF